MVPERLLTRLVPWVFVGAWIAYGAALQRSVRGNRPWVVLVLTLAAALLAGLVAANAAVRLRRIHVTAAVAGNLVAMLCVWTVVLLEGDYLTPARIILAATAAATLIALWLRPMHPRAAGGADFLVLAAGVLALHAVAIVGFPHPPIDVWTTITEASHGLLDGRNFYQMTWADSPRQREMFVVKDAFTSFPWTVLLLRPGEWLLGGIRWAMAFWTVVGLAGLRLLAPTALRTAGPALLLVTIPGAIALATNAWTEPLLFAAFAWWAALMRRGHPNAAMVPLAGREPGQQAGVLQPVLAGRRTRGHRARRDPGAGSRTGHRTRLGVSCPWGRVAGRRPPPRSARARSACGAGRSWCARAAGC